MEKSLQHHVLVFPGVQHVFWGERDVSGLGRINIFQTILQEFSSLCNSQGNTAPKWELKLCSCIIWTNTGVEPQLMASAMEQFAYEQKKSVFEIIYYYSKN